MLRLGMVGVTVGSLLAAVAVLWFLRVGPFRPALTCTVKDPQVCQDTLEWVGGFDPNWSLYPPLPGRIAAIEVRPVPPQWADSLDPEYRDAEWATLLHRDGYAPVLVACGYGSGDEVLCSTEEGPFARESPAEQP
jgi:hypothetical protein